MPQGLILGPIFVPLYINDLPLIFQGVNFVLYADDTNLLAVDKGEEVLQHKIAFVIQHLEIWFHKNNVIVNIEKKHVHYHFIPTKSGILVDLTSC